MKKLLILILAILMAFSFSACTENQGGVNDGGKDGTEIETESGLGDKDEETGEEDEGVEEGSNDDSGNESGENSNIVPPIFNGGSFGGGNYN